jgi:hypothetical protein
VNKQVNNAIWTLKLEGWLVILSELHNLSEFLVYYKFHQIFLSVEFHTSFKRKISRCYLFWHWQETQYCTSGSKNVQLLWNLNKTSHLFALANSQSITSETLPLTKWATTRTVIDSYRRYKVTKSLLTFGKTISTTLLALVVALSISWRNYVLKLMCSFKL